MLCKAIQDRWIIVESFDKMKSLEERLANPSNILYIQIVKVIIFLVVMYGCESWIIKKTECQSTDALERWCWRRLLRVPWTARKSNQSILKEINLEELMLLNCAIGEDS